MLYSRAMTPPQQHHASARRPFQSFADPSTPVTAMDALDGMLEQSALASEPWPALGGMPVAAAVEVLQTSAAEGKSISHTHFVIRQELHCAASAASSPVCYTAY